MILFSTKPYCTFVEHFLTLSPQLFCFNNIHSSSSFLFASLAQTRNCAALLPELLIEPSSYQIIVYSTSISSAWLLLKTLKQKLFRQPPPIVLKPQFPVLWLSNSRSKLIPIKKPSLQNDRSSKFSTMFVK